MEYCGGGSVADIMRVRKKVVRLLCGCCTTAVWFVSTLILFLDERGSDCFCLESLCAWARVPS
jgi:hypothetical protein